MLVVVGYIDGESVEIERGLFEEMVVDRFIDLSKKSGKIVDITEESLTKCEIEVKSAILHFVCMKKNNK